MATSKKEETVGSTELTASEHYDRCVAEYSRALELLHGGEFEQAKTLFLDVAGAKLDEPMLAERARTYASVCNHKLTATPFVPQTAEDRYLQAVLLANSGELDQAIHLFNQSLADHPTSPKYLYARASAYALKSNAEAAISDLRQAIGYDPQCRFRAINDSDFEKVREEPAFIDIIEPTPSGV